MKKIIYVSSFTVLSVLITTLLHAGIEMYFLSIIVADTGQQILYLSWEQWKLIHLIGSLVLLITGVSVGIKQGFFWWDYVYVQKKR